MALELSYREADAINDALIDALNKMEDRAFGRALLEKIGGEMWRCYDAEVPHRPSYSVMGRPDTKATHAAIVRAAR